MEKVKITQVYATNKKKDGTEIKTKFGKTSWRVGIKTAQHGDQWLNGFLPFNPDNWEGTEQGLIIEKGEFNGQEQLNFRLPPRSSGASKDEIQTIVKQEVAPVVEALRAIVDHFEIKPPKPTIGETGVEYPDSEISNGDGTTPDVPF